MQDKKQSREKDDFLRTLATIINTARWFGIPSQGGITAVCMSLIVLLMLLVLELAAFWKLIRAFGGWSVVKGSVTARLSGALFYGNALFSHMLSWRFISNWQELSLYWAKIETLRAIHLSPDDTVKKKMITVTYCVVTGAIFEHVLSIIAAIGFNCPAAEFFKQYILNSHGFLLHSYEYSFWIAVPLFVLSKLATILWNFQDLIIILVSMGLSSRYRRLNFKMNEIIKFEKHNKYNKIVRDSNFIPDFGVKSYSQVQTWRRLREAYVRQAELVRRVDNKLGALILLSNLNNLYFICLQLFLVANNEQGPPMNRIYLTLSLSWLMLRTCSVVLAAADINIHLKSALSRLQTTYSSTNVEVSRLKTQLQYDNVAIQGMGLFALDRKLLLKVAAAVLKYELILVQFDK